MLGLLLACIVTSWLHNRSSYTFLNTQNDGYTEPNALKLIKLLNNKAGDDSKSDSNVPSDLGAFTGSADHIHENKPPPPTLRSPYRADASCRFRHAEDQKRQMHMSGRRIWGFTTFEDWVTKWPYLMANEDC